jgi:D-alanyl-D-alanine carboxypeptidase
VCRFGSRSRARRAAAGLATAVVAVAVLATTAAPVGASVADRPRSAALGFVFNDGRYRKFEALSPRVEIFPSAINDGGYVTGEYMRPDRESGFVRDSRGRISTFDVPGARATEAVKLNDRRQIVGRYSTAISDQIEALMAAAEADGLDLTGHGHRDHARQIALRRAHCGTSYYAIYQMPAGRCSPPTARPGTSMHERGLAIDFSCDGLLIRSHSNRCYRWLAARAAGYGLYNLPSEA